MSGTASFIVGSSYLRRATRSTLVMPGPRIKSPRRRLSREAPHLSPFSAIFRSARSAPEYLQTPSQGLRKLDPGAVVPLHEHTALEQTFVLEGTIEDHEGVCGPGQFVWRPAGNQHEAVAPNGALILGFFLKPNRFASGEKFFTEERAK